MSTQKKPSTVNKRRSLWDIVASVATGSNPATLLGSDGNSVPQDFIATYEDDAGSFELLEAKEGDNGPARFKLMANSGTPMRVNGFFDPVVVDMKGARYAKASKTAVIQDHDTSLRIGHATEQVIAKAGETTTLNGKTVKGPLIAAMGIQSSNSTTAKDFIADANSGFPFQVSIGARIIDGSFIEKGETVEVNGKKFKGPLIVAHKSLIRELSVTVLGADGNTSATITATTQTSSSENEMDFEAFVRSLHLDPTTLTADQKKALEAQWKAAHPPATGVGTGTGTPTPPVQASQDGGVTGTVQAGGQQQQQPGETDAEWLTRRRNLMASEDTRVSGIQALASRYNGDINAMTYNGQENQSLEAARQTAIQQGHTVMQFENACLRAARPVASGGGLFAGGIHVNDPSDFDNDALACSILRLTGNVPSNETNLRSGRKFGLEHMFTEQQLEASHNPQYQVRHISQLFDLQIRATGKTYSGLDRSGSDFQAAAVQAWQAVQASGFSTLNITNVLENTMHKAALASFGAAEGVWRQICGRRNMTDFRPHNLYRLSPDGTYKRVSPTGELKHVGMSDEKYSIQADTFGAMITIDRKTRKNDDLGMVVDQARGLGTLGAQRIEESVFVLLLSNPAAFFSLANNNLLTGATSALGSLNEGEGLDAARMKFRNQVVNGKPTSVSPRILLTGTTMETTANRLYTKEQHAIAGGNTLTEKFVDNPHKGLYKPVISPYMNNTAITDEDGKPLSGQSDKQWMLLADPSSPLGAVVVIGFMDGRETPYFDEAETQFNVPDGLQMRSYLDWGVAMHVKELGVKSAGE